MYYAKIRGIVMGPLTEDAVREMISRGQIGRNNMMSENKSDWFPAASLEIFFPASQTMSSSASPGASRFDPSSLSPNKEWYVSVDHKTGTGPYSQQDIYQQFSRNEIFPNSLAWRDGVAPIELKDSPEFTFLFPPPTTAPPFSNSDFTHGTAPQSNTAISNSEALPALETGTTSEISRTITNEGTRPTAWVFLLGTIFSISLLIFLMGSIIYLNRSMEQKVSSSLAVVQVISVILLFGMQTFVLVEFWLYFAGIRTLAQRKDLDSFIVMSQRLNAFWRALAISCCAGLFIVISLSIITEMSLNPERESVPASSEPANSSPADEEMDLFEQEPSFSEQPESSASSAPPASTPKTNTENANANEPSASDFIGEDDNNSPPKTLNPPKNRQEDNSTPF